jgi:HSP20 family protein
VFPGTRDGLPNLAHRVPTQSLRKPEISGRKLQDFDIQLENNALTLRDERRFKFKKDTSEENYHRVERRYGSFARVFTLPNTLDQENVKAHYDADVSTVELSKRAESKPAA